MKQLLEAINRGILRSLRENNIELLVDLDDDKLDQLDSLQAKSVSNNIDGYVQSIKSQLIKAINTKQISKSLKEIINSPNNFHKFKSIIKANDKEHLKQLIEICQKLFGNDGNFNWIDTSEITDMSYLFHINNVFNGHIELWDVSNVTDMAWMFTNAKEFNQPIGDWDVRNVRDMRNMFGGASKFNQPIDRWNVFNVNDMRYMFSSAAVFNQPIGDWDVSNVTNMSGMFQFAKKFNQPIGDWDVSNVADMEYMFLHAEKFNQPLNNWDVMNDVNIEFVFAYCPIKKEYKPTMLK